MAWFIFKEEEESGHVVHTVASAALVRVPLLSEWGGMVLDEMWPAQTRVSFSSHNTFLAPGYF